MKKLCISFYPIVLVSTIICALTACALHNTSGKHREPSLAMTAEVQRRILPLIERLYHNSKELKEEYRDLRAVSQAHAFRGDNEQLNYVQKAALYIQKSHLSAMHQWEVLSLIEDIRPAAIVDYYTLRYKGISQATVELVGDERFITIYRAYIKNAEALEDIDAALKLIVDIRNLFDQLKEAIAPLVRKKMPFYSYGSSPGS